MHITGTCFALAEREAAATWAGTDGRLRVCTISERIIATRPQRDEDLTAARISGEQADRRPPKH